MEPLPDDPTSDPDPAARIRRRRRIFFAWLAVAAWAGVVWRLGGDDFSAQQTQSALLEWFRWMVGGLDDATRRSLMLWLRKSAHFVEYAILAALTFRAALLSAPRGALSTAGWVAIFLVATLATADEARQAFSPVRTGSPWDVVIDLLGGGVAILGLLTITRRVRQAHATPSPERA